MINCKHCVVLSIATCLSVVWLQSGALAQTANPDAAPQTQAVDPPPAERLVGDWGGLQPRLQATGINIKLDAVTEFAGNAQSNIQDAPCWASGPMSISDVVAVVPRSGCSLLKNRFANRVRREPVWGDRHLRLMSFTQLSPELPVTVIGKGDGVAFAVIDYGEEQNLIWVVALDDSGEIWCSPNPIVRMRSNWTMGRTTPKNTTATGNCAKSPAIEQTLSG